MWVSLCTLYLEVEAVVSLEASSLILSGYVEVYVVEYGKCNPHEFPQLSDEKVQEFWKYYEQFVRRVERDGALNNGAGAVLIADYDGFGLNHYASAPGNLTLKSLLASHGKPTCVFCRSSENCAANACSSCQG